MKFVLDLHCHTIASGHAHSTLEGNAAYARQTGLQLIGVADHAPGAPGTTHLSYFDHIADWPDNLFGVPILKGVEANIMGWAGELDLPNDILAQLDFVIVSMHGSCMPHGEAEDNTAAAIAALEHPHVHILGHPGDISFPLNLEKVVLAAKRTCSIIEINNASLSPGSSRYAGEEPHRKMLDLCKKYEVPVIAGSDAHQEKYVGRLDAAKKLIEESGIDEGLVLNTSVDLLKKALAGKAGR